jgi:DMSO reductase family type II enzyme heme b subunit
MPAWDRLPKEDLSAAVQYIKSFSTEFAEGEPDKPITIGKPVASTAESVAAGAEIYVKMKCAECHGKLGRGDGPSAGTHIDEWGFPIRPFDFTRGAASMKGGGSPEDIFRTFMTGLAGTPMPAYADLLKGEQGWQLVHHVQSLFKASDAPPVPEGTPAVGSAEAKKDPSLDPNDAAWKDVPATVVPLRPLWARDQRAEAVQVRVAVGPTAVAFRFEWRDPQNDEDLTRNEDFRDAVAIQVAPEGKPGDYVGLPFIGMGDKKAAIHLWHWKSDWAADIAAGKLRDVGDRYAAMHVDKRAKQDDRTTHPTYLTGLAAGNAMSSPKRKTPVEALVAKGFGTLTSLPPDKQTVEGKGVWKDGSWSVVMRRPRNSDAPPTLRPGGKYTVAVAVWDGSSGDRDGQKLVSQWLELTLAGAPSDADKPLVAAPPAAAPQPPPAKEGPKADGGCGCQLIGGAPLGTTAAPWALFLLCVLTLVRRKRA